VVELVVFQLAASDEDEVVFENLPSHQTTSSQNPYRFVPSSFASRQTQNLMDLQNLKYP
jgi:hypothetical protein